MGPRGVAELSPPADAELDVAPAIAQALAHGTLGDPFSVLGLHTVGDVCVVRVYLPGALQVVLETASGEQVTLQQRQIEGLFVAQLSARTSYRLLIEWPDGFQETEDPYLFGLLLGDLDLHLIGEGTHYQLAQCLGAHPCEIDGAAGARFAVWAPNAQRVAVVGNFNRWDARRHGMRHRVESGVWELFIPGVHVGDFYQYQIIGAHGPLPLKSDPLAQQVELPPRTASVVCAPLNISWSDEQWMRERAGRHHATAPIAIYEVHASSWRRHRYDGYRTYHWDDLADTLVPYVAELGFTHIELMPITAHPFSGSWGYQPLGLFAPQPSLGDREAFARFIDRCHGAGLGVILDWVPAHFPGDVHGLARFDGTALYEHEDLREGYHNDWQTWIYNLGRREVAGFLLASALYWLEQFHIDGLRVDAVSSMLYRDYSRAADQWVPNRHGGRENLEAIDFLRQLNSVVRERAPGAVVIAEESTAWPGVSRAAEQGGLGFDYKWNMGWMHDTLSFMQLDPIYRGHEGNKLTFGLVYAFTEQFVLALSHDEVVHGKGSLLTKMAGDRWQQMANLRAYLSFMWTHPGKKLLFMGGELAQEHEWNHDTELNWELLENPQHRGVQLLVSDLNRLYRHERALHIGDCDGRGFRWVIADDHAQSVFAFLRAVPDRDEAPVLVVCNFTPVPRYAYRVGVPCAGYWREVLNSDADHYGGSSVGNAGGCDSVPLASHGMAQSLELVLPPLATVVLVHQR